MANDVAVELFYDGAWHDLVASGDVLADSSIIITRGDGDEGAAPRPCSITLRLNNDDDMFRVSNPESPLYGKAGVNTRIRVSVGSQVRGIGEIASWRCGQSASFRRSPKRGKAWTDIEANGLLYRINQWTETLKSTMTKGMLSFTDDLVGVWPLEDESGTTILSQLTPGGTPGVWSGDITLGSEERPAGSARSLQMATGAEISGGFIASSSSGWQVSFAMKLATPPGSATFQDVFSWTDTTGRRWAHAVNNASYKSTVYDTDGVTVLDTINTLYTGTEPNQWIRWGYICSVSGSTVSWTRRSQVEGATGTTSSSSSFTGTAAGALRNWQVTGDTYNTAGWYTAVFGIDDPTAVLFNAGVVADFNGHVGETAGDRFTRIMSEAGLSSAVNGDTSLSAAMGAQPADTLANLLREILDTDDAILADSKSSVSPFLSLRNYRYNQTPALTLDVSSPDESGLTNLPPEVTDDLPINNRVTASQRDGGESTAEDSTGPMGTQAPPNGRGEIRQKVDVNVADETTDLPVQANWWLRRGTVDLPRYPQVTVNLAALDAARVAEVETVTIGSVLEITGYRENTIRQYVLGYIETISWPNARSITFTCAPDQQFDVGTYDGGRRYDSASTTVKSALTLSGTAVTFRTTDIRDVWSTTAVPYDVMIAGQRSTVTSMGAASLASGAYDQAAVLTRGVNGIRKAIAAGEPIRVANKPGRYAR